MPQVLKEEIRDRIFRAGIEVFYEKDYRSAKMQDIAEEARIPVGLIYSYFKNKKELFEKIASSVPIDVERIARAEEAETGLPSEKYKKAAESYFLNILEHHKVFVILMDKSYGTQFENAKGDLIRSIEAHIKRSLLKPAGSPYHDMLVPILANNFAESLLEVARHYRSRAFAQEMLALVTKCYYEGVNSLHVPSAFQD